MVPGNSITFEGQQLTAYRNYNGSCQILEKGMQCVLYIQPFGCRSLVGHNIHAPCEGYPIIFLPHEKYLELRLMGEA